MKKPNYFELLSVVSALFFASAGLAATSCFAHASSFDESAEKAGRTLEDFGSDALREEFELMPDDVDLEEKSLVDGQGVPADDGVISVILLVEKSKQTLKVKVNGTIIDTYPVSTGAVGHTTPNYTNRPVLKMVPDYWSRKYDSPMPYSIFITPAIALHATTPDQYPRLGQRASHGCIRQTLDQAKALYAFVKKHRARTRIWVVN